MRLAAAVLCVFGTFHLAAQQTSPVRTWERVTPESEASTATSSGPTAAKIYAAGVGVAPLTHQRAMELVKLAGARAQMLSHVDEQMQKSKESYVRDNPKANPAYVDEWVRVMRTKFNVDEYVAVFVRVYESHFTSAELLELIGLQREVNQGRKGAVSPALQQKMARDGIAIQSEIMGGCAQLGARAGGEAAKQVEREHPDWAAKSQTATTQP